MSNVPAPEPPTPADEQRVKFILQALARGGYADGKDEITDDDVRVIAAADHWLNYEFVGHFIVEQVTSGEAGLTVENGVLTSTGEMGMAVWCIEHDKPLGGCAH